MYVYIYIVYPPAVLPRPPEIRRHSQDVPSYVGSFEAYSVISSSGFSPLSRCTSLLSNAKKKLLETPYFEILSAQVRQNVYVVTTLIRARVYVYVCVCARVCVCVLIYMCARRTV